jgi:hypothetical protein
MVAAPTVLVLALLGRALARREDATRRPDASWPRRVEPATRWLSWSIAMVVLVLAVAIVLA